jgi:NAD(P)H-dependent FMN reductase
MEQPRILVIPGSARQGSVNVALATGAIRRAQALGMDATLFDLRALDLPIYDGDLEKASGVPQGVYAFQRALEAVDGVLVVTPEYNGFPTPLVINAFDWLSRIQQSESQRAGLATTANKPTAVLAASPGVGGALRSMNTLRLYLQMAFQMIVVPQQFGLGHADEAFDDHGNFIDPRTAQMVDGVLGALRRLVVAVGSVG